MGYNTFSALKPHVKKEYLIGKMSHLVKKVKIVIQYLGDAVNIRTYYYFMVQIMITRKSVSENRATHLEAFPYISLK